MPTGPMMNTILLQLGNRPLADLISKLNGNRRQILELITNLPDEQLSLKGIHPKFGTLTIVEWTEFFLLHEAHHLFTMFRMAKA